MNSCRYILPAQSATGGRMPSDETH